MWLKSASLHALPVLRRAIRIRSSLYGRLRNCVFCHATASWQHVLDCATRGNNQNVARM
jgi:hypothetical protein